MSRKIAIGIVLALAILGAQQPGLAENPKRECIPHFNANRMTFCESVPVGPVFLVAGPSQSAATVSFSSRFFIGLQRRVTKVQKAEFRRGGKAVAHYPDEISVTIEPVALDQQLSQTNAEHLPKPAVKLPPGIRPSRVVVQWLDESQRPTVEQSTELEEVQEAWTELRQPRVWYQGRITRVNQPLATAFAVIVFGENGKLLGMLKGAALIAVPPSKP